LSPLSITSPLTGLLDAASGGDHRATGRLITLVEAGGDDARTVSQLVFPRTGGAWVVGVTGAPGSGKSTLVDSLVTRIRDTGERVAVVAIDPSSPYSGGAILGDRVRMQGHSADTGVFVRSMATRGQLGGLAAATLGAVRVLDAAGWPWIVIETVGAGQVELDVTSAADTTVVVVTPGWGDSLQAAKAGLLEVADVFAVNKADRAGADEAVRDLEGVLDLAPPQPEAWRPPVVCTTAVTGEGVDGLWNVLGRHRRYLGEGDRLAARRTERLAAELRRLAMDAAARAASDRCQGAAYDELLADVAARRTDPETAARLLDTQRGSG
jgi:LAO/AO transport system kinase